MNTAIVFSVLKITGIVLLSILAVILVMILIILFVPVRYCIKGRWKAEENYYDFRVDVTWLFKFVHGVAWFLKTRMKDEEEEEDPPADRTVLGKTYKAGDTLGKEEGFGYEAGILFFRLFPRKEADEEDGSLPGFEEMPDTGELSLREGEPESADGSRDNEARETHEAREEKTESSVGDQKAPETTKDPDSAKNPDSAKAPDPTKNPDSAKAQDTVRNQNSAKDPESDASDPAQDKSNPEREPDNGEKSENKGIGGRIKGFFNSRKKKPDGGNGRKEELTYKINRICDKIGELRRKVLHYRAVLSRDSTKRALVLIKIKVYSLLKAIRPGKIRINLLYGFGDPYATGQVTALFCALFPNSGKCFVFEPDFDRTVVEGDALIKGRVMIFTCLYVLLRIYFDKDFRKFYGSIRS